MFGQFAWLFRHSWRWGKYRVIADCTIVSLLSPIGENTIVPVLRDSIDKNNGVIPWAKPRANGVKIWAMP